MTSRKKLYLRVDLWALSSCTKMYHLANWLSAREGLRNAIIEHHNDESNDASIDRGDASPILQHTSSVRSVAEAAKRNKAKATEALWGGELSGFVLSTLQNLDYDGAELAFKRIETTRNTLSIDNETPARHGYVKENTWLVFEAVSVKTWHQHRRALVRKNELHHAIHEKDNCGEQTSGSETPLNAARSKLSMPTDDTIKAVEKRKKMTLHASLSQRTNFKDLRKAAAAVDISAEEVAATLDAVVAEAEAANDITGANAEKRRHALVQLIVERTPDHFDCNNENVLAYPNGLGKVKETMVLESPQLRACGHSYMVEQELVREQMQRDGLKLSEMRQTAQLYGIEDKEIEKAEEDDNPKYAYMELLMKHIETTDKKERDLLALDKELDRHNKQLRSKLTTHEIDRLKSLNRELNQRTAKNCWSKRGVDDMDSKVRPPFTEAAHRL